MDADPDAAPLAAFEGVTFRYPSQDVPALDGLDLRVRRGEFVGVIGATGAGKSTFMKAFNGIVPQFYGGTLAGAVLIAGQDTVDTPTGRLAAHVGMVLEDPEMQITASTVEGEVAFALENRAVASGEIRARVTAALAAVGLAGLELKYPANLSGGQKQRLAIAAAIALASDILVLDEPTAQLDPVATEEVFALLRRLNREDGVTVVVASHASEALAEIADRILLLAEGRIVADGPSTEVFADMALLTRHHVRPPDITQAFAVLTAQGRATKLPVTLEAALAAPSPIPRAPPTLAPWPAERGRGGEPALVAADLRHVYPDGTEALGGISLSIAKGSFTAIVGENGSGKSTLVKHFLRLLGPTSGTVTAGGTDVAALKVSELARRIGYIAQNAHQQIFCDRVAGEVAFALKLQRRPKAEIDAAVERSLAAMDLVDMADRHPLSLSRGDRLRTVIAAVLALDPQILIFDEPTTGQDWRGALAVLDILKQLNALGRTVVLITHHLYLLPGYVERLVLMSHGRVVADGPLREIFYTPEALRAAGLTPPQTVRYAEAGILAPLRPLGPADLALLFPQPLHKATAGCIA